MSVDIEYPLPGDTVGTTFRVGGSYDRANFLPKPAAGGDTCGTVGILVLPPGSKVRCRLINSFGIEILPAKEDLLGGAPDSGTWEVEFSLDPMTSAPSYSLEATLYVGATPGVPDTTANITIRPAATGPGTVIVLP